MTFSREGFDEAACRRLLRNEWGLEADGLTLLRDRWNIVLRVDSPSGVFLLRVHSPRYHPPEGVEVELRWLESLVGHEPAPVPVRTASGALLASVPSMGRVASVLRWIEGEVAPSLPRAELVELGGLSARLHRHAATHREASLHRRPRWTAAHAGHYLFQPRDLGGWSGLRRGAERALRDALSRMGDAESALPPAAFGLIHADLHARNLVRTPDGALVPIDFDDCGVGCWLHDLAVPLAHLRARRASAEAQALLAGYRAHGEMTDDRWAHLDAFVEGRVASMTLFLRRYAQEGDPTFTLDVEAYTDEAVAWLSAGTP